MENVETKICAEEEANKQQANSANKIWKAQEVKLSGSSKIER